MFEVIDATGETAFSGAVNVQPSRTSYAFLVSFECPLTILGKRTEDTSCFK